MADFSGLYGVDNLARKAEHSRVVEARAQRPPRILRQRRQRESLFNNGAKVRPLDVRNAGTTGYPAGEDSAYIRILRDRDAVGGDQNGAAEFIEFFSLVLPSRAVVAYKMLEPSQLRIAVGREHFTVGIDVDAFAFGLLEQLVEIEQVVTGNDDSWPCLCARGNGCRCRIAERRGVSVVEHFHCAQVHLAGF